MKKLLVICGPTASGKTCLGVKLARKFRGELISADSRQVYQEMDIGTGKDLPLPVPVWGLDLVRPNQKFSVAHWLKFVHKTISALWEKGKLPIVVGGTGFWIKALITGIDSIGIPPNWKLRRRLSRLPIKKLRELLEKTSPGRLNKMNKSDRSNPRRLTRAIEISKGLKTGDWNLQIDDLLIIGLKAENQFLYQRIDQRVKKRIEQGIEKEVKGLLKKGYSWDLEAMTATGYQEWQDYFKKKISYKQVIARWKSNEHAYARRQMTFFKKMKGINWFEIDNKNWEKKIVKFVRNWYDRE